MKAEVIAVGATYLDINARNVPVERIGVGKEIIGGDYEIQAGSSPINFVRIAQNMGIDAMFVGKIGNDHVGRLVELIAQEESLPVRFIKDINVRTNISENNVDEDGKQSMVVIGTANQSLTSEELLDGISEFVDGADYLYIGSCFKLTSLLSSFGELATGAKEMGMKTIVDHGRIDEKKIDEDMRESVRKIIPLVDIYLPSKEEFCILWEVSTIEEGLKKLAEIAPKTLVIVKDDKNGCFAYSNGELTHKEAFEVEKSDGSIGAGDTFNGAFIAAIRDGKSVEEAMEYSNAAGALKVSESGIPTRERIDQFLLGHST